MFYTWKSCNIEGQVYINNKAAAFFFLSLRLLLFPICITNQTSHTFKKKKKKEQQSWEAYKNKAINAQKL